MSKVFTENEILAIFKNHSDAVADMMNDTARIFLELSRHEDLRDEILKDASKVAELLQKNTDEVVAIGIEFATQFHDVERRQNGGEGWKS